MSKKLFYIVILLGACFASCNKKSSSTPKESIMMSAQVNGRPWAAHQATVALGTMHNYHISINVDSGKSNINLYINNYVGNAIYPLANINNIADSCNRAYFTVTSGDTPVVHKAAYGLITIQNNFRFSEKVAGIQGYFAFNADTFHVTNGYFYVLIDQQ